MMFRDPNISFTLAYPRYNCSMI
jgi:hypothetical protein